MSSRRTSSATAVRRLRRQLRRPFDLVFDLTRKGKVAPVLLLALVAFAAAVAGAAVFRVFHLSRDGEDLDFPQALWESMIRTLDPGQLDLFASGGDRSGRWGFAIVALILTVLGVLLVASLISVINNSVSMWVERSARGRSKAPRRKHGDREYIVMLGWSDLSLRIIRELAASATVADAPDVLVLAPLDIRVMEQGLEELRAHEESKLERPGSDGAGVRIHKRRVQFRTGDPTNHQDLRTIAAVDQASSVIVLAPPPADPDGNAEVTSSAAVRAGGEAVAAAVTTVFAVEAALHEAAHFTDEHDSSTGRPGGGPLPVVVEVPEYADDRTLLEQLEDVFGREPAEAESGPQEGGESPAMAPELLRVIRVDTSAMQAALAAQVVRQAGLSEVYLDLVNFDGSELYLTDEVERWPTPKETPSRSHEVRPEEEEPKFGQAVTAYKGGIVLGIIGDDGPVFLPEWDSSVAHRPLIVLREHGQRAADFGDAVELDRDEPAQRGQLDVDAAFDRSPVLIVGWNRRAPDLLIRLRDNASSAGGIHVVIDPVDRAAAMPVAERAGATVHEVMDTVVAWVAGGGRGDQLSPPLSSLIGGDDHGDDQVHAVFLANERVPPAESDASILVMQKAHRPPRFDGHGATIVAEIRQRPTRALATRHERHDLVVGHGLTALLLAQFARNPDKYEALCGLLCDHDLAINFVERTRLDPGDSAQPFRAVQLSAWRNGMIALGWRSTAGLRINPAPDELVEPGDDVVVLRRSQTARR